MGQQTIPHQHGKGRGTLRGLERETLARSHRQNARVHEANALSTCQSRLAVKGGLPHPNSALQAELGWECLDARKIGCNIAGTRAAPGISPKRSRDGSYL